MKVFIYSVFDVKTAAYGTPFFAQNDQVAVRSFERFANDNQAMAFHSPQDFSLRKIGEFDDSTAVIKELPMTVICEASAVKAFVPASDTVVAEMRALLDRFRRTTNAVKEVVS